MDVKTAKTLRKMSKEELLQLLYTQELELAELREAAARAEDRSLYAREFWEMARVEVRQHIENAWAIQRQAEAEARWLLEAAQHQANTMLWNFQQIQANAQIMPSVPASPAKESNEWWFESVENFGKGA